MMRWLDTLLIHDFHHTAQRLSEEQQQKEEATLANQTSITQEVSNNEQLMMNREGTGAGNDPDVCITAAESADKLDVGDHNEPGIGHQTHETVVAEAAGVPASCDHKVSGLQDNGMNVNNSDLVNPPQ